jgi:hypothetical protein
VKRFDVVGDGVALYAELDQPALGGGNAVGGLALGLTDDLRSTSLGGCDGLARCLFGAVLSGPVGLFDGRDNLLLLFAQTGQAILGFTQLIFCFLKETVVELNSLLVGVEQFALGLSASR